MKPQGYVVGDYEITRVRMVGGRDRLGKSRVWICEPFTDGNEEPQWMVMHRTSFFTFPAKVEYAPTFEKALEIARALVLVYDAELAHETRSKEPEKP